MQNGQRRVRPIGSPKPTKPPTIDTTVVPAVIRTMTGTARPVWRPRWKLKKAAAVVSAATASQGEVSTAPAPWWWATPVSALTATSAAP